MVQSEFESMMIDTALDLLPPLVKRSLVDDRAFLKRWGLVATIWVTLGDDGPSFRRKDLFDAFRQAMRTLSTAVAIMDSEGRSWNVFARQKGATLAFSLEDDKQNFPLSDHSALSDSANARLAWFENAATAANLPADALEKWHLRLSEAVLEDEEFDELIEDLNLTPIGQLRQLSASIARANADISILVPHDRRYYERLVGKPGDQGDVASYIDRGVKPLVAHLLSLRPRDGFLLTLLLSSAASVSATIDPSRLAPEELLKAFKWLAAEGDLVSQIGAIEVGLAFLDRTSQLEPLIERLVLRIIEDDPGKDGSRFSQLSGLIVVVAAELARTRTLDNVAPFWSRQAAIAQASLAVRAFNSSQIDPESVTNWAKTSGVGHLFFLRGLIDLRLEPRWLPDFVDGDQLKAEFLGRIVNAARNNESNITSDSLRKLLLAKDGALSAAIRWPFPFLPGPLEGSSTPQNPIPPEVLEQVRTALAAEQLEPNSFSGLVNTALLCDLPSDQSGLAAAALRRVKYSIENAYEEPRVFGLIGGLAIVAAVTRGAELADELRILTRVMRRRGRLGADPDDELRVAMIAAASRPDLNEWAHFAGEWISEIAFEVADQQKALKLRAQVRRLVQFEPALARHCAIADATLSGFGG